jgi:hypothetical protein
MIGVFHHPEDVRGLLDGEIELFAPAGALIDVQEAEHVAV